MSLIIIKGDLFGQANVQPLIGSAGTVESGNLLHSNRIQGMWVAADVFLTSHLLLLLLSLIDNPAVLLMIHSFMRFSLISQRLNYNHIKEVTMYKYTYLLSDSYRKEPLPNNTSNHSFSQPEHLLPLSKASLAPNRTLDSRLQQLKRQYQNFKSNQILGPSTAEKNVSNRMSMNNPLRDAVVEKGVPDKGELEKRLRRLTTLGERHQQALRQVDLQNKFVAISQKYDRKDKQLTDPLSNDQYTQFVRTRGGDKSKRNQSKEQKMHVLQGQQRIDPTAYFPHSHNSYPSPLSQLPSNNILNIVSEAKLYSNQPYSKPPAMCPQTNFLQLQNDVTQQSVKTMIDEHLSRAFKPIYPQSKQKNQRFTQDTNKIRDENERGRKVDERVDREHKQRRCREEEEPTRYCEEEQTRYREEDRRDKDKVNSGQMPFSCSSFKGSVLKGKGEEARCKENRMQSVQKLNSLQERIKSSIKPYLNI